MGKKVGLVGAFNRTSPETVLANLSRFRSQIELRPGAFPESFGNDGPEQISMMHVDLNWAKPTIDALEWSFPRWSHGGICLLDDYLWTGYEDQRIAVARFFHERRLPILALPTGQGIVFQY